MAQLIVERMTLINFLLPQDEVRSELAEHVLTAMINMFYVYLIKAQLPQMEAALQWVSVASFLRMKFCVHFWWHFSWLCAVDFQASICLLSYLVS